MKKSKRLILAIAMVLTTIGTFSYANDAEAGGSSSTTVSCGYEVKVVYTCTKSEK